MNRSSLITFAGVAALAFATAACSGAVAQSTPTPAPSPAPTPAALVADVDVGGGRTLHIVCVGPTDTGPVESPPQACVTCIINQGVKKHHWIFWGR